MSKSRKQTPIEDLTNRAEKLALTLKRLEQEIQEILASGEVAPTGCWIVRYQAKGRKGAYWYYKLQASEPIFPTKNDTAKCSRYKHLGKAGSQAYLDAVEQVARRAQIEGLLRSIETLKQGWADLTEEASKSKKH